MKTIHKLLVLAFLPAVIFSCQKEVEPPVGGNKIEIGATTLDNYYYYTASLSTMLTGTGGNQITQHGHCWSIENEPTIEDDHTQLGSKNEAGKFTSDIDGLEPNVRYYARAYITTSNVTVYGDEKEFSTLKTGKPVVTTAEVQNITLYSSQCGGLIVSDSGLVISTCGVCWNKTGNPELDNCIDFTTDSIISGTFFSQVTNLEEGNYYYIVAYAVNEKGTSYGEEKSFQTIPFLIPEVETADVTNPTTNSAQCGGNVIDEGNGTVTARGVCWNTTGNPSLENCIAFTNDGGGPGSFISNIGGLNDGTNYFVRAYATNEKDTGYGEEKSFQTFASCGEVNYGGQIYNTIVIGDQCWFRENLNIGTRIDGIVDQEDNPVIEKYCYNDQQSNCDEYGGLYQWDEMMQYVTNEGVQGICPDGWHIPTDDEWDELVSYLGGSSVAGGKMKESGYAHWNSPNTNATNSSGFTGLPGGHRNYSSGSFNYLGYRGYFWSSSEHDASGAWDRYLYCIYGDVYRVNYYKTHGFSVRCLQD